MRVIRAGGVAVTVAAIAAAVLLVMSGGPVADAASGHSPLAHGLGVDRYVIGTITYSGHGSDVQIAGTTVPPGSDGAACTQSTSHVKVTDSYTLGGHDNTQSGGPRAKVSAKFLEVGGTSGCNATGQAGTSYACTAGPSVSGNVLDAVSRGSVKITVYTTMFPGTARPTDGESCPTFDNDLIAPDSGYLEVGGTFTVPVAQIEKTHKISVRLDSRKAVNCAGDHLALPARATVCVDSNNAKDARCDLFPTPVGGSASCAITNHWVETITFHLSRVCAFDDGSRAAREKLATSCPTLD